MLTKLKKLKFGKSSRKSQKGMALILVLGSIFIITAVAVEFAYNTNVNYHLARNELDRLKAYYLAKSAYKFMQIELKFDRLFRQVVQSQNLGQFLGASANLPLCQQFPISTSLIRAVFLGGEGADILPEEFKKMVSMSQEEEAQEFLNFDGDFDGECIDESTKINLNFFNGLNPLQRVPDGYNEYDRYKIDLQKFLGAESYEETFEELGLKVQDITRNLADWVDNNELINELGGVETGPEIAIYDRTGARYPIKNGKMTSLDEAYLIEGVIDEWFTPLKPYFTIYGDGTVNVCSADEYVVQSVIRRYFEANPNLPPVRLDDAETMQKLITAVYDGCAMGGIGTQLKQQIENSLNAAIGLLGGQTTTTTGTGTKPATGKKTGFATFINTTPQYFRLSLTGAVGNINVNITAVLDTKEPDPKKWRLLYWRVY